MKNLGSIFNQITLETLKESNNSVDKLLELYNDIKENKVLMVESNLLNILENSYIASESIAKELIETQLSKLKKYKLEDLRESRKILDKYIVNEEYKTGVIVENLMYFTMKNDKNSEYYKCLEEAIKLIVTEKKEEKIYDEEKLNETINQVKEIEELLTEEQKEFVSKIISSTGNDLEKLFETVKKTALEKINTKLKKEQLDSKTRKELNEAEEIISNYKFDYDNLEQKFTYLYEISNNF